LGRGGAEQPFPTHSAGMHAAYPDFESPVVVDNVAAAIITDG
jgi:hypothetical protein